MAFSLEAALVVPCVISCSLGLLFAAPDIYQEVWRAARLEVTAAVRAVTGTSLYRAEILTDGDVWTTTLQSSPQVMFELASLMLDDSRLLLRQLSDISSDTEAGREAP
jgi:hypothetical protein